MFSSTACVDTPWIWSDHNGNSKEFVLQRKQNDKHVVVREKYMYM